MHFFKGTSCRSELSQQLVLSDDEFRSPPLPPTPSPFPPPRRFTPVYLPPGGPRSPWGPPHAGDYISCKVRETRKVKRCQRRKRRVVPPPMVTGDTLIAVYGYRFGISPRHVKPRHPCAGNLADAWEKTGRYFSRGREPVERVCQQ